MSGSESAGLLDVLAAAYAETGRFAEAAATAKRALAMAAAADPASARSLQDRLQLYEAGAAFHEPGRAPAASRTPPE